MASRRAYQMVNEFQFPDGSTGYFQLRIQPVQLAHSLLGRPPLCGFLPCQKRGMGAAFKVSHQRPVVLFRQGSERVRQALEAEPRAYLTIINEEKEAVIAGHPDACARVIAALDCHALRMPFDAAIHAPTMQSEYAAFVDLYTLPTRPVPGIDFYSAAEYAPLTLERDALAHALAKMTCAVK